MSRTYTLHVARDAEPGDPAALDDAELVHDGFSWGAFVFTALWFFWHRLWLVGAGVLVGLVAFGILLRLIGIHPAAAFAATLLINGLIGLEAGSLRRWSLRRKRPDIDVVRASSADEAESKSFARYLAADAAPIPAAGGAAWQGHDRAHPVIGLFPDAERVR